VRKPLLILDVDETLVYADEKPVRGREPDFRVGPYLVYRRPFVAEFLAAVGQWFELAVWSSASGAYVNGVVANVFGGTPLAFVWACDRCTRRFDSEFGEYFYAKNLSKLRRLGYALERTLIIDDSPEKLARHYGNHIRVRPFTGDPTDRELLDLLPFLEWVRTAENVRTIEKRTWRAFRRCDAGHCARDGAGGDDA
jgi:TFIIF-interacting CTD phosphatase-like protein